MTRAVVLFAYEAKDIKPGWVALVLVLALAVATYVLWRSMNKQLRKIDVPTQQEIRDAEAGGPQLPETSELTDGDPHAGVDCATEKDKPPGS